MNSKNKKAKLLEKQLQEIDPKIKDWVLRRYLRFCHDQQAFNFLSYRKKYHSMNFDRKHNLGFKIRRGMRKKQHYHLKHPITDVLTLDPEYLGPRME